MYVAALRSMIKDKEANAESPSTKFIPTDLVDFMVARAKIEPLAFCVLIELRFAEIIFLFHQAEKQSRNDLFLASIKFLLPLYASTHAIKYVSMLSDFLIDWYCMSETEKIIFAKAVITRKTKNGRNICTDRFVEWMMRDMRMWLGKHASTHHHKLVKQVAVTLNDRKKKKSENAKKRKAVTLDSSHVKELELNNVFCESLLFANESNLWGPGNIGFDEKNNVEGGRRGHNEGTGLEEQRPMRPLPRPFKSIKGVTLNKELVFCVSIGLGRLKEYFKTFLVDGDSDNPTKRSEKESDGGVSLKKIDTTKAEDEKDFNTNIKKELLFWIQKKLKMHTLEKK